MKDSFWLFIRLLKIFEYQNNYLNFLNSSASSIFFLNCKIVILQGWLSWRYLRCQCLWLCWWLVIAGTYLGCHEENVRYELRTWSWIQLNFSPWHVHCLSPFPFGGRCDNGNMEFSGKALPLEGSEKHCGHAVSSVYFHIFHNRWKTSET